jgi:hypothetical protein
VSCDGDIKCQSGYCINGVCCNTPCDTAAGGTCSSPGHVGQCTCSACPGGTCQLFYQDQDGDTYGDVNATLAGGTAKFACAGTPPAGFSADHTDCFDAAGGLKATAAQVHPNATGWYYSSYTIPGSQPSFDYDCDGKQVKEYAENASCNVCAYILKAGVQSVTPQTSIGPIITHCLGESPVNCSSAGQQGYHNCYCFDNSTFFPGTVNCGAPSTGYQCGTCATSTGSPQYVSQGSTQQGCR